jgi:hypothetical protein
VGIICHVTVNYRKKYSLFKHISKTWTDFLGGYKCIRKGTVLYIDSSRLERFRLLSNHNSYENCHSMVIIKYILNMSLEDIVRNGYSYFRNTDRIQNRMRVRIHLYNSVICI